MDEQRTKPFYSPPLWMLLAVFCAIHSLGAQTGDPADSVKVYDLEEVIVTSSRTEKKVGEVGRSVTVLTTEDLLRSGARNLGEVLSQQAGLYVLGAGQTPGALQTAYLRGANNNQTVILIDGVRITDPSSVDNAIDLSELSLLDVDRIEIVRGTHSTLYGSSAIGGVINMITKKAGQPGWDAVATLRGGTFGAGSLDLSQQAAVNYTAGSGFFVGGQLYHADVQGIDATLDTITDPAAFKNRDRDDFRKLDLVGKAGFKNEKWNTYLSYRRIDQAADVDQAAFIDDDNFVVEVDRNLWTYGAGYQVTPRMNITYAGGFSDLVRHAVNDSSVVDAAGTFDHAYLENTFTGRMNTQELQASLRGRGHQLVLGTGRYEERMSARTYYFNSAWNFESEQNLDTLGIGAATYFLFANVDLNGRLVDESWRRFNLALGARWNGHETFGTYVTYEINPSFDLGSGTLLYGSYATGFNAPSLYRLYAPDANYLSGIRRGNENLQPETSSSLELGLKKEFGNHTLITLAFFQTVVDNAIDYVYLWDKNIGIDTLGNDWMRDDYRGDTYLNIGRQTTRGVELTLQSRLGERWQLRAQLSLLDGRLEYSPSDLDRAHTQGHHVQLYSNGAFLTEEVETDGLVRRPHTAFLQVAYQALPVLSLRADMQWAGPRDDIYYESSLGPFGALDRDQVEAYTLIGLMAQCQFNAHFSATLRGTNLLNTSYQELLGYRTRGRGVSLQIRYSFN